MVVVSQQDFMIAIFELGSLKTKFVVLEMENQRLLLFANAKEIMSICIIVYVLFCLYIGRVCMCLGVLVCLILMGVRVYMYL